MCKDVFGLNLFMLVCELNSSAGSVSNNNLLL